MTDIATDRLEGEIAALRAEYDTLEGQIASVQGPYDSAWEQCMAALREDKEPPADADRLCNSYNSQIVGALATQKNLLSRIAVLSLPAELERRLQDRAPAGEGPKEPRKVTGPKLTARDRGVPDVYLGDSGNFKPGYDAKLKSDLITAILGNGVLHVFTEKDALAILKSRGWESMLEKSRVARERKNGNAA